MESLYNFIDKKLSYHTHSDNKYIVFICTFQSRLSVMWIVITGLTWKDLFYIVNKIQDASQWYGIGME